MKFEALGRCSTDDSERRIRRRNAAVNVTAFSSSTPCHERRL
jgi:hypothetical protein